MSTSVTATNLTEAIESLTEAAASIIGMHIENCAGACLGTSAMLAQIFTEHGVHVEAVHGTYGDEAHWWLETSDLRIDATRGQFDDGPTVEPLDKDSPYTESARWPAGWDADQAVQEFAKMSTFPAQGFNVAGMVQMELNELAGFAGLT